MKLNSIEKTKNIRFTSGLSKKDIRFLNAVSTDSAEMYFKKACMIKTDFNGNQTFSVLNLLCKNILTKLQHSRVFDNIPFNSNPNSIKVFNANETARRYPDTFCISTTKKIIKNQPPYKPISLFFYNDKISLEEMNEAAQIAKKNGFNSNDNFLSFTMHEWMHGVHLNYLYKKNNFDEQKVIDEIKKIKEINFSNYEKSIIQEYLGEYVFNNGKINPMEVAAEGLNKIICSCLSKDKVLIASSIDESAHNLQTELIAIIKKAIH